MRAVTAVVTLVLHASLLLSAAPLLLGMMEWLRARLAGLAGPSPLAPWRDLRRLAGRQRVLAENASGLLGWSLAVRAGAIAAAVLLVPSFALGMASAKEADLFVVGGLLLLAGAADAITGLDAGAALGGLGASRGMNLAALGLPAFAIGAVTLSIVAGSSNLDAIVAALRDAAAEPRAALLLTGLAGILLACPAASEVGTRPDLTGIAAPARLELAGPDRALALATDGLALVLRLTLLGTLFLPFGIAPAGAGPLAWLVGAGCWAAKTLALGGALVGVQTLAPPRLAAVPHRLGLALVLALAALLLLLAGQGLA